MTCVALSRSATRLVAAGSVLISAALKRRTGHRIEVVQGVAPVFEDKGIVALVAEATRGHWMGAQHNALRAHQADDGRRAWEGGGVRNSRGRSGNSCIERKEEET